MVKVTEKFQVTIPEEVRKRVGLKPGEEVEVQAINDNEILIKRKSRKLKIPLSILIGDQTDLEIPPEKVDEFAEG
jgi:looped-hinge helix DNA binding domain, AbrB family